ncbi:dnaJ homolog subfamily C member 4-like [Vespa mandarinia]|uniref:dnaJ homolog subfamily C member 4-like n=1 Tax=Vespa mandarinia TaxID=7446 RepID=UPI001609CB83|nr:dnaJ homolog subfamily C member 4-like [Vespa mandarinia]
MQISRINKLELFSVIFRGYGTHRSHKYYEILEVSPDCSQKEIRRSFIALSKKFHPDIMGKEGHDKFVALQEAYNVLSKEHTRKQYDMSLKYNTYSSFYPDYNPKADHYHVYRSRREWEEHMARGNWQPNYNNKEQKNINSELLIYTIFGIFLIIFQLIIVQQGLLSRIDLMQIKYQKEYNAIRQKVKNLTFEEQMDLVKEKMRIYEEEVNRRKFDDKK